MPPDALRCGGPSPRRPGRDRVSSRHTVPATTNTEHPETRIGRHCGKRTEVELQHERDHEPHRADPRWHRRPPRPPDRAPRPRPPDRPAPPTVDTLSTVAAHERDSIPSTSTTRNIYNVGHERLHAHADRHGHRHGARSLAHDADARRTRTATVSAEVGWGWDRRPAPAGTVVGRDGELWALPVS